MAARAAGSAAERERPAHAAAGLVACARARPLGRHVPSVVELVWTGLELRPQQPRAAAASRGSYRAGRRTTLDREQPFAPPVDDSDLSGAGRVDSRREPLYPDRAAGPAELGAAAPREDRPDRRCPAPGCMADLHRGAHEPQHEAVLLPTTLPGVRGGFRAPVGGLRSQLPRGRAYRAAHRSSLRHADPRPVSPMGKGAYLDSGAAQLDSAVRCKGPAAALMPR